VWDTGGLSRRGSEASPRDDRSDQSPYFEGVGEEICPCRITGSIVSRTSWFTETGCKPDQAADQACTDNGSQETVSRASTRAATVRCWSPRSLLLVSFQRCRTMLLWGRRSKAPSVRAGGLRGLGDQSVIRTGSPSGVRRMKDPTAFACT
jgi:hypothetical protein